MYMHLLSLYGTAHNACMHQAIKHANDAYTHLSYEMM